MPEDITKTLKVTFRHGLPAGRTATFKHEKEMWIAVPLEKNQAILTVTDNLLGAIARIKRQATCMLSTNPEDVARLGQILAIINQAEHAAQRGAVDKIAAQTA